MLVLALFHDCQTLDCDGPGLLRMCLTALLATIIITVRSTPTHNTARARAVGTGDAARGTPVEPVAPDVFLSMPISAGAVSVCR